MSIITTAEYEEALRDWLGRRVRFRRGWRTRTSAGGFDAHGVLHHWTAMSGLTLTPRTQERVLARGRPGLAGPLCHLSPRRSGLVAVIAGPGANANHAGAGDPDVYRRVLAGRFDGTPAPRRDRIDGNAVLYGFEYQFHPADGRMPDEQVEAGILAAAALAEAHGWDAEAAAGSNLDHFEWTSRKWDRRVQNLANRTRAGVRHALRHHQEEDMSLTDSDVNRIAKATVDKLLDTEFAVVRGAATSTFPFRNVPRELEEGQDRNWQGLRRRLDTIIAHLGIRDGEGK